MGSRRKTTSDSSYVRRSSSDYSPPRSDISERVIYEALSATKHGLPVCPHCKQSVQGNLSAFVCWKFYHIDHIFCCMCNAQILEGDDCYDRDGFPACAKCYTGSYDVTCAVCDEPLGDCKPLPKVYFVWKGRIYCHDHIIVCIGPPPNILRTRMGKSIVNAEFGYRVKCDRICSYEANYVRRFPKDSRRWIHSAHLFECAKFSYFGTMESRRIINNKCRMKTCINSVMLETNLRRNKCCFGFSFAALWPNSRACKLPITQQSDPLPVNAYLSLVLFHRF
uniref:LIM zinc-binding domain-containing protein n=1 Tax=Trichuris muris TaxID=70415 RepID=A0A5S6Q9V6_TRIMR